MIGNIDIRKYKVVYTFKSRDLPGWICVTFTPMVLIYVKDGKVMFKEGKGWIYEKDLHPVTDPEDQFHILQQLAAMDQG